MSTVVEQPVHGLPADYRQPPISALLENAGESDPAELDRLQALIDARRKSLEKP